MKVIARMSLVIAVGFLVLSGQGRSRPLPAEKPGAASVLVLLGEWFGDAHAAGLPIASFCPGNFLVNAAGLADLPEGLALLPEKVTMVKDRVLLGPRGGGFSEPERLDEGIFGGQVSGPCVSPDNRTLIVYARKEGGFGGWDLYVSFRNEVGNWGRLVNQGAPVKAGDVFVLSGDGIIRSRDNPVRTGGRVFDLMTIEETYS